MKGAICYSREKPSSNWEFKCTISVMRFSFRSFFLVVVCSSGWFVEAEDWPHFLGPTWNFHSTETNLDLDFPVEGPRKLWEFPKGKGHAGPVVVDDHVVLMHQVDEEEVIHCLDAATGKVKWEHRYPVQIDQSYGITDTPRSSPTIDVETKTVYTLGNDGDLIAFQLKKGKVLWKLKLSEELARLRFSLARDPAPWCTGTSSSCTWDRPEPVSWLSIRRMERSSGKRLINGTAVTPRR